MDYGGLYIWQDFLILLKFILIIAITERRSSLQIGNTTITPLTKQEQLTLSNDSDNLSERDEAEAEVCFLLILKLLKRPDLLLELLD